MGDINSIYVDPAEQTLGVLGTNYLQNYLTSGMFSRGFCVVTNKRVYFKGKCLTKNGGIYKSSMEQRTLDVKDVTGTGFVAIRFLLDIVKFLLGLFFLFISIALWYVLYDSGYDPQAWRFVWNYPIILLILYTIFAVLFFIYALYRFKPRKVFEIEYAGGKIAFPVSVYNFDEVQNFQNALSLAKDNYVPASQEVSQQKRIVGSGADEILKYKQLLDEGAISQEEFEIAKAKLLR